MSQLLSIFNKLTPDNIADYYQALYWYCHDNHEGQFSALYSVLSTLQYKPAATEKSTHVDWYLLGFIANDESMLLLATALRLWSVVQREAGGRVFVKLHWVEGLDLYLAEYHDYNEDHTEHDTYYLVYSISGDTIINETLPEN